MVRREDEEGEKEWAGVSHDTARRGADGAMRWHFALHFTHSCCHQQATAEGESERDKDASREMDKTERKGRRDDEKGRCDERLLTCTFASAYYFYSLPFNCCCYILPVLPVSSPPTISALVFPSSLSAEADIGHAPPAGSSKVCGGGPAVSNEIPSVRFQTSTRSFAYSSSGTKWWTGKGSS